MYFVSEDQIESGAPTGGFSAGVFQAEILPARREDGMRASRFTYEPGARSDWHTHDGEQALYVVAGRGVLGREGEQARYLEPGSWVHVEPGERHWHGAVPHNVFAHLAITATGGTNWFEAVSDETYDEATRPGSDAPPSR